MHPGTVDTKMLRDGWGNFGTKVEDATDTFYLATDERYENPGAWPLYYRYLRLEDSAR